MIFKDFCIAIGNFSRYRELLRRRVGDVIVYATVLLLVCSIGLVIVPTIVQGNKVFSGLMQELPNFELSNDGLTIAEPFDFEFAGLKILATNEAELTEADFGDSTVGILMDRNKVIMRNIGQTFSFGYNEFDVEGNGYNITKSSLPQYRGYYYLFLCIFGFVMLIGQAFSFVLNGLLIGLIASVACILLRIHAQITELVKLAMYSQTLPLLLTAIMLPFGMVMNSYIAIAISVVILVMSMRIKRIDEVDMA